MNPAIDKLVKYMRLEAKRGHDNRAVLGGLQRMLEPWEAEARQTGLSQPLIETVVSRLRDYPNLSPTSRKEVLQGIWNRLQTEHPEMNMTGGDLESPPAAPVKDERQSIQATEEREETPSEVPHPTPEPGKAKIERKPNKSRAAPPLSDHPALEAPLTRIQGIGPKSANTLKKLDLETLGDLLWHLPRRYDDYSKLKTINRLWYGEEITIIGTVDKIQVRTARGGKMKIVEAAISDGTGSLRLTWFNQPWIADRLKPGRAVVVSGKVDQYLGRLTMNNPEWEPLERKQLHTNRIVPVYPLTAGITAKWIRRLMNNVVPRLAPRVQDSLPDSVLERADLIPLGEALQQIHFPDSWEQLEKAQHRLAFDEMFLLQLGVLRQKQEWEQQAADPIPIEPKRLDEILAALPYELTKAQRSAVDSVRKDLAAPHPMNRLLQGDVGSGKTVVAAVAMAIVASNGKQSALMAPTSILAEQHLLTLRDLLPMIAGIPADSIRLLIGATPEAEKAEIRTGLVEGSIPIIIGTHALLEDPVEFADFSLAVIDEQHRFGVEQRAKLRAKGDNPSLMVMTATPIPRSLALTVYGDLEVSVIDEIPPGRQKIETRVLQPIERTRAYSFTRSQIDAGHQAFIIFPLVEESEKIDAKAAVEEHERLQAEEFNGYKLGLLHGRMSADEKETAMAQFRAGEIDAMVSTSVVEVGVDIPNATVMLVEGANRFGLAQLHQFRGRVGRGAYKSYCLLIADQEDETANKRLSAMESTDDGFKLAALDLEQRGPGDFLGTRQSGFAELRMASLTDVRLIEKARREALRLFAVDPMLSQPEHAALNKAMARFWIGMTREVS
ncbi:MAG TPA: ATP-dependent DNA helicase RecG [Anaerolineae bacterium]|nr:ATP-dependent DNA helicase RecG [Anaerolineae bacterium]